MLEPAFAVGGRLAGRERHERTERFDLQHLVVGIRLEVAAVVGIAYPDPRRGHGLAEERLTVHVAGPALRVREADFGRECIGHLPQRDQPRAEMPTRIVERGVRPDHHTAVRQKVAWVFAQGGLRDDFHAAGFHHGERPRGERHRLRRAVGDDVVGRHRRAVGREREGEGLFQPERFGGGIAQGDGVAVDRVLDRAVVEGVGAVHILRGDPEAVAAADFPLGLAMSAELFVVAFEEVLAVGQRAVGEHARTDLQRDDGLGVGVEEPDVALPAGEGDDLGGHRRHPSPAARRSQLVTCRAPPRRTRGAHSGNR